MPKWRRGGQYFWGLSDGERTQDYRIDPILVANDPGALTGALICGEGLLLNSDVTMKAHVELGPVSYTHLDVYKRQHADRARLVVQHPREHAQRRGDDRVVAITGPGLVRTCLLYTSRCV